MAGDTYRVIPVAAEDEERLSALKSSQWAEAAKLVHLIAGLTKDGERDPSVPTEPYIMENDDAVDSLHSLISDARRIYGLPDFIEPEEEV